MSLFSLIQQVVAHIPHVLAEKRIPVADFGPSCTYYDLLSDNATDSTWEYCFEPVVAEFPAARLYAEAGQAIRFFS